MCLALFPYGWASNPCLRLLFAPCSCRRICWWSSRRPQVFENSRLSPVFFPFRGSDTCLAYIPLFEAQLESLAYSIPCFFLVESLSALAEGLAAALLLCPERALRLFSLRRSRLSPLSRLVLVDVIRPLRVVTLAAGVSPHALGSVGAHGIRIGSTYIALR